MTTNLAEYMAPAIRTTAPMLPCRQVWPLCQILRENIPEKRNTRGSPKIFIQTLLKFLADSRTAKVWNKLLSYSQKRTAARTLKKKKKKSKSCIEISVGTWMPGRQTWESNSHKFNGIQQTSRTFHGNQRAIAQ